jgi:ribosomal protein L18E
VTKALNISAHRFTKTAKDKIQKAGGSANQIVRAPAEAAV